MYNITLIGCGKMGGAMARSWLASNLTQCLNIIDPTPLDGALLGDARVSHANSYDGSVINDDILILAVKPQILKQASQEIAVNLSANTLLLSIAAGQSISTLENIFGADKAIIRAMPNTPAAIGKGVCVCVANCHVNTAQKKMADVLLNATGQNICIEDENLMDAVTALSGSGPAYVFYLIEALAKSGEAAGLESDMAMSLARQTVIGSAALAEQDGNTSAATLRENVTSRGGTTQAALDVLMDGRLQNLLNEAVIAAKSRSEELD